MKKVVSLTLSAALMLSCTSALLVGCGNNTTDAEHTIFFYTSQGQSLGEATVEAINNFQAKYPGWKVEHTRCGGYDDVKKKVMSDLQGQQQPDLAYCYADHVAQYLPSEQVIDMTPFINSTETVTGVDTAAASTQAEGEEGTAPTKEYAIGYTPEELSDFTEVFYNEGKATNYSGYQTYGYAETAMLSLPFVRSTELMYYNIDALEKIGEKPATTWEELWAQADKVKKEFGNATLLGYDSEANWAITMCEQNGWGYTNKEGEYLFKDDAKLESWLDSLNPFWEAGMLTTQQDYKAYTSGLFTKGVENSAGGTVYCIGSSGGASNQKSDNFKVGITQIPGTKKADGTVDHSVISQGPSLVMFNAGHGVSNADEKAKMTFLFIKELLDPTFQASFSKASGYNPCRESVYKIPAYKAHLENESNITGRACNVAKDLTNNFFTSPAFVGSSEARTQIGNALYYVMRGEKTASKALADAYKNCGGK